MLSCKQVATLASQYLDDETNASLKWKIRLHLMMCANCRRFMRHLNITRIVVKNSELKDEPVDSETIWENMQKKIQQEKDKQNNNIHPENKK